MRRTGVKNCLFASALLVVLLQSSALLAQFHVIKHDSINAFGWFGGDDRPGQQRTVGVGQGVLIDTAMTIERFSFYFKGPFDYAANPESKGHEATLVLNVRDAAGSILKSLQVVVPDTFSAGWVTWTGIDLDVDADSTIIFTCYLAGGFDTAQYTASHGADFNQGYTDGVRYVKDGISDADLETWTDWSVHPSWDSAFQLEGSPRLSTAVNDRGAPAQRAFALKQNYPNPFNPSTTITYTLQQTGNVELRIVNSLGQAVRTYNQANQPAGDYSVVWDARDELGQQLPSGIYFYQLSFGNRQSVKRMIFVN